MQNLQPASPQNPPLLLGISKVATCMDVSVRTVWSWILNKKLPTIHVGRRRLIRLSDLERFIEDHQE